MQWLPLTPLNGKQRSQLKHFTKSILLSSKKYWKHLTHSSSLLFPVSFSPCKLPNQNTQCYRCSKYNQCWFSNAEHRSVHAAGSWTLSLFSSSLTSSLSLFAAVTDHHLTVYLFLNSPTVYSCSNTLLIYPLLPLPLSPFLLLSGHPVHSLLYTWIQFSLFVFHLSSVINK